MYRVNAERSQGKNDRIERAARCTKVTRRDSRKKKIAMRSRRSFAERSPPSCSGVQAEEQHFNATQHGAELMKRCSPFPRSIMTALFEAKDCVKERAYGRFE
jgi:hypothetical protein